MIYFIRHAPTNANLTGSMVNGYDNTDIIKIVPGGWEEKVGKFIPENARKLILSSPAKRCEQTAELLFNKKPNKILLSLNEYDCKKLGNKKFWEITESEFNDLVKLSYHDMVNKAAEILFELSKIEDDCIVISHGMVIRYLYHFINGNPKISAYDVINSKDFKFANLDLMILDPVKIKTEVIHYKDPIKHQ